MRSIATINMFIFFILLQFQNHLQRIDLPISTEYEMAGVWTKKNESTTFFLKRDRRKTKKCRKPFASPGI
jgi:hypothetical protein